MVLVFVALTKDHPIGGAVSRYYRANTLARRGHAVHVVHVYARAVPEANRACPPRWFRFDRSIQHHLRLDSLPTNLQADVALGVARRGIVPPSVGLPFNFLQGRWWESRGGGWAARTEGPIACISNWLVEACTAQGIAPHRLRHIPNGLDHATFRILEPPYERRPRVAFLHHPLPAKGARDSVAVLDAARVEVPDLQAVAFGVPSRPRDLPDWIEYVERPDHHQLAAGVYNTSRAFLCSSRIEGFGNTSLEAMACGCALVTLDTGGSRDYAHHGDTALVAEQGDLDTLAANLVAVLQDRDLHRRLVTRSLREAQTFTWDRSTDLLEALLREYVADSDRFLVNS
jgi:glycosyltransferase involved in cell wall biosynthesis